VILLCVFSGENMAISSPLASMVTIRRGVAEPAGRGDIAPFSPVVPSFGTLSLSFPPSFE